MSDPWTSGLLPMADLLTPMAIRVAATLRLADHVAGGASSPEALAARAGTPAEPLRRLMRHLVAAGLFTDEPGAGYRLTPLGEDLRDRGPACLRAWLDIEGAVGRADLAFVTLLEAVRGDRPGYPLLYGAGFWEDLEAHPQLSASLDRLMGDHPAVDDVLSGFDWSAVGSVTDVGGGDGTLLAALLTAHEHLRGTLVERAGPAATAARRFDGAGLAPRAEVVVGDFFEPLPAGADVYLLSRVLGDWGDEPATAILRRCAEAAGAGGTVLVQEEGLLDGDAEPSSEMDLRMFVYVGGRDRTRDDLAAVAGAAGLRLEAARPGQASTLLAFAAAGGA